MNAGLRFLTVMSAIILSAAGSAAQAQPSAQEKDKKETVADAARRARAERERKPVAQTLREFTNDTLPPARFPAGSEAATSATIDSGSAAAGAASTSAPPSEADEKERSESEGALKAEKEKLGKLKGDLDLLEREAKLNKASFYGKPDSAGDRAGAANIAAQDAALAAKKTEITETEAKIKELEDKSKTVNDRLGPRAEEPKTQEQQRDSWAEKTRPLRDELAKIDAELAAIQQERTAQGGSSREPLVGFTGDRIAQLQRRRGELQRQISDIEDDARRAGTLPVRN